MTYLHRGEASHSFCVRDGEHYKAYNDEASVLNKLQHPNIIVVFATEVGPEIGTSPDVGMYAIIMEYMDAGSLEDRIMAAPITLREAIGRVADACRGAEKVHASGYVHRDIKPANILIAGNGSKLSDFGLTRPIASGTPDAAGTPFYLAPEVIDSGITSQQSDLYALGVTLYECVNGFDALQWNGSTEDFVRAVSRGEFPDRTEYLPYVPDALRRILKKAMHPDPLKRFGSVEDFRHAILQIPIQCEWQRLQGAKEVWQGESETHRFQVTVDAARGCLELFRAKGEGAMRKSRADCLSGATMKILRKHQRELMQRMVSDGK